jgi:hypothetical protein
MKTLKEEFEKNLTDFRSMVIEMATDKFNEDKGIEPTLFGLIVKDNKMALVVLVGLGELFVNDQKKDLASIIIKEVTKELKLLAVCLITEAWAAKAPINFESVIDAEGNYIEGAVRASEHPDKKETLTMNFESNKQEAFECLQIIREGENVSLKKLYSENWKDKKPGKKGRFKDLVMEDYSEFTQQLKTILKDNQN